MGDISNVQNGAQPLKPTLAPKTPGAKTPGGLALKSTPSAVKPRPAAAPITVLTPAAAKVTFDDDENAYTASKRDCDWAAQQRVPSAFEKQLAKDVARVLSQPSALLGVGGEPVLEAIDSCSWADDDIDFGL